MSVTFHMKYARPAVGVGIGTGRIRVFFFLGGAQTDPCWRKNRGKTDQQALVGRMPGCPGFACRAGARNEEPLPVDNSTRTRPLTDPRPPDWHTYIPMTRPVWDCQDGLPRNGQGWCQRGLFGAAVLWSVWDWGWFQRFHMPVPWSGVWGEQLLKKTWIIESSSRRKND